MRSGISFKDKNPIVRLLELLELRSYSYDLELMTEELYRKDLNDPVNHDGVISHLEPDILECEGKWALGSITTNKACRGQRISAELFKILKDNAVKTLHSICQQI